MLKKTRRPAARAVLLAIAVSAAACACTAKQPDEDGRVDVSQIPPSSPQSVPLGRYVETDCPLPDLMGSGQVSCYGILPVEDGFELFLYDYNENKMYCMQTKDGAQWHSKDEDLLRGLDQWNAENELRGITQGKDGAYYCYYTSLPDGATSFAKKIQPDGAVSDIPIDFDAETAASGTPAPDNFYSRGITIAPDGSYYLGNGGTGGVLRFTAEGELANVYADAGISWAVEGQQLAYLSNGSLIILDTDTEQQVKSIPLDKGTVDNSDVPQLLGDGSGGFYLFARSGAYHIAAGGGLLERMIDGAASVLGMPSYYLSALAAGEDDSFLLFLSDGSSGKKIVLLRYDAQAPSRPDKTLEITTLTQNATLRQAAIQYQLENPDTLVHVREMLGASGAVTKSDAIRTLNTELLAGKGPDILCLDGMPADSYVSKGILMDMAGTLQDLTQAGTFLPGVTAAYQREEGLYMFPLRVGVPYLVSDKEGIAQAESLHTLAQYAQGNPAQRLFYDVDANALAEKFFPVCARTFFREDDTADAAAIAQFLTDISALCAGAENGGFTPQGDLEQVSFPFSPEERDSLLSVFEQIRAAYRDVAYSISGMNGFRDLMIANSVAQHCAGGAYAPQDIGQYIAPLPGMDGMRTFQPFGLVGINAHSGKAQQAEGLIRLALGEQIQATELYDGFPVNRKALQRLIREEGGLFSSWMGPDDKTIEMGYPPVAAQNAIADMLGTLTAPAFDDAILCDLLLEEAAAYFSGQSDAASVAEAAAQRMQAYLLQ